MSECHWPGCHTGILGILPSHYWLSPSMRHLLPALLQKCAPPLLLLCFLLCTRSSHFMACYLTSPIKTKALLSDSPQPSTFNHCVCQQRSACPSVCVQQRLLLPHSGGMQQETLLSYFFQSTKLSGNAFCLSRQRAHKTN